METATIDMQEFRNATKEKRGKGRPKLTEEEKMRRIKAKAIRLSHINEITSQKGILLSQTNEEDRICYKWIGGNDNIKKKLDKIDKYELITFTNKLGKFTLDQWLEDFERVLKFI